MSNILKKILPRALQATGSPTDLESTWAQQEALPPSVAADQLLTETCVGPYEVLRRLGDGEFSTVVECRKADTPETFALKVIGKAKVQRHSSILKSKRNISRVNREVRAMRAANHAGVCRLYDVMQTPSHIYLVLEKGDRDLYALIDDYPGGCPETVVKSATRILVLALRHCHNAKIAHRDIKPENILVCGDPHTWHQNPDAGIVKLCDFGLCADIPEDGALLQDFVGSPGFFAPELLQRPSYDGARADLFSLGAVRTSNGRGASTAVDATPRKDSLVVLRTQARSGHGRADFWPRLLRGRLVPGVRGFIEGRSLRRGHSRCGGESALRVERTAALRTAPPGFAQRFAGGRARAPKNRRRVVS